jgi:TonB family protein
MRKYMFGMTLGLAALLPLNVEAQQQVASAGKTDPTYLEFQVELPAKVKTPVTPEYPVRLFRARVEGEVLVQFTVDERGQAVMETFKVLRSSDNEFTEAVKRAVKATSFHPAEFRGKKVRQLVQVPYAFDVQ